MSVSDVPADMFNIERELTRLSQLITRVRQHERLMALAGVSLERAGVNLLRELLGGDSYRLGELAGRLGVEASHVTRQVQVLEREDLVARVADPDDRRAQRVAITDLGREVIEKVRVASAVGMRAALADWSGEDLRVLASLLERIVRDLSEFSAEVDSGAL